MKDVTTSTSDMDRLRERNEPGLREALTQARALCARCGAPREALRHSQAQVEHMRGCIYEEETPSLNHRIPLAPDSAHVALERWCVEKKGWLIEIGPGWYSVGIPSVSGLLGVSWFHGSGDTLAGAVLAALEAK